MTAPLSGLVAVLALLSGVGMVGFGWWLGCRVGAHRAPRTHWTMVASVLTAIALTAASEFLMPAVAGRIPYATLFEFHLPAGLFAVGIVAASGVVSRRHLRRPTLFAAGLFTIWATIGFAGPLLVRLPQWGFSRDSISPPQYQSTWWCCGATATANLLRERGAPISERDAAILCGTRPWVGTSLTGLSSGLDQVGVPNRVVHFASTNDLMRAPKPCLAITRVFGQVLHVVTVLEADGTSVRVIDPMVGEYELTPQEFEEEWVRCLVVPTEGAAMVEHNRAGDPPKV